MTLEPLPDGVHSFVEYRPEPDRLSPNGARKLLPPSTPYKFDYDRKHPQKPRRVFDFGTVAHKLVLGEGDQFLVLDPEIHGLKKDGTEAANPRATTSWISAESNARAEGLTPIHIDEYGKAIEMARVVHQHPTAGPLLAEGDAECWLYWHDTESGQGLRQRLDWMDRRNGRLVIVEYKTAISAHQEVFSRKAVGLGYYLALAFAIAGAKALGLDESPDYLFVVQEKEPPFEVNILEPDEDSLRLGNRQMREAIGTYQRCIEAGEWPSYPLGRNPMTPPLWAFDDEMEFAE